MKPVCIKCFGCLHLSEGRPRGAGGGVGLGGGGVCNHCCTVGTMESLCCPVLQPSGPPHSAGTSAVVFADSVVIVNIYNDRSANHNHKNHYQ